MPIYLSFLLSKRNTNRVTIIPFFLKFSISSVIKTYFLRVRALVFIRSGDPFTAHDRNQRVVVSWERSVIRISYPCSGGVFSLKIAFTRFNSGYIFLPLLYFFLVLIVWHSALLIYVVSIKIILLLLFCYLIKGFAFFFLFISFIFYFIFLTVLERKTLYFLLA